MEKCTRITLYPRNIVVWLSTIAILLLAAHLITIAMPYIFEGFEHGLVRLLFSLFFLDGEGNVPSIFSTLEESLEMGGLIILVYALLLLLRHKYNGLLLFMPGTD